MSSTVDTRVTYLDANLLLIILPTAVSPFVTGGVGLQTFDFQGDIAPVALFDVNLVTVNKFRLQLRWRHQGEYPTSHTATRTSEIT